MNKSKSKPSRLSERLQDAFKGDRDPIFGISRDFPRLVELELSQIRSNPDQARKTFDEESLNELAASIEKYGLIQPIMVKKVEEGYLLVAGERRVRAHQKLHKETIFAIITVGNADEISLIENIQRENLNALEEAEGLAGLIERHGYTQEELGKVVGKRQSTVSEIIRLVDLPEEIKREYRTSDTPVSKSVLIEIARLSTDDEKRELWEYVKHGTATVRAVRGKKARQGSRKSLSSADRVIAAGKQLIRQLAKTSRDDLVASRDQYDELLTLRTQINEAIERLIRGSN